MQMVCISQEHDQRDRTASVFCIASHVFLREVQVLDLRSPAEFINR